LSQKAKRDIMKEHLAVNDHASPFAFSEETLSLIEKKVIAFFDTLFLHSPHLNL